MKEKVNKESIIAEYLTGDVSYRKLGLKYSVDFRTINDWVLEYQGRMKKTRTKEIEKASTDLAKEEPVPSEVKQLQVELRKAKLLNAVLNEVINVAEQELGLPIRKKPGTKQS